MFFVMATRRLLLLLQVKFLDRSVCNIIHSHTVLELAPAIRCVRSNDAEDDTSGEHQLRHVRCRYVKAMPGLSEKIRELQETKADSHTVNVIIATTASAVRCHQLQRRDDCQLQQQLGCGQ